MDNLYGDRYVLILSCSWRTNKNVGLALGCVPPAVKTADYKNACKSAKGTDL